MAGEQFFVKHDEYGGVTIDASENHVSSETFERGLNAYLEEWRLGRKKGIWIKVPTSKSEWIPIAVKYGFDFHHAQPGYAMLTKWLPENEESLLPLYPFTSIGVGGLVVAVDKDEVLLIKERVGRFRGWKFPGGLADPDEDIYDAVQREVAEETGLSSAMPSGILLFRQQHRFRFPNCSDFYFVCLLVIPSRSAHSLKPCEREVSDCRWFLIDEAQKMSEGEISHIALRTLKRYREYQAGHRDLIRMTFNGLQYNRRYSVFQPERQSCGEV